MAPSTTSYPLTRPYDVEYVGVMLTTEINTVRAFGGSGDIVIHVGPGRQVIVEAPVSERRQRAIEWWAAQGCAVQVEPDEAADEAEAPADRSGAGKVQAGDLVDDPYPVMSIYQ